MQLLSRNKVWLVAALTAVLSLTVGVALAHEGREVGPYRFVVGWVEEPAYEGFKNGVELQVTKMAGDGQLSRPADEHEGMSRDADLGDDRRSMGGEDGHGDEDGSMNQGLGHADDRRSMGDPEGPASDSPAAEADGHGDGGVVPVAGLQDALQVEVTYPASGESRLVDLRAVPEAPGHYRSDLIPTAPGIYVFRVFGSIEGDAVDETFPSMGAGGQFDDIRSVTDLQFPQALPGVRELESAVRGALDTAQQAQDAALAASADDSDGPSVNILAVVAIVLGAVGIASGVGAAALVLRRR